MANENVVKGKNITMCLMDFDQSMILDLTCGNIARYLIILALTR